LNIQECRVCGGRHLDPIRDLGAAPLAGARSSEADAARPERVWPLGLVFCPRCALLQASATVPADLLAGLPQRLAPPSPARIRAAGERAAEIIDRYRLGPGSLVLGLGSGDGTGLAPFAARGIETLGVEPAALAARRADESGIPTLRAFFGDELAATLLRQRKAADLILAGGVLARAPDLDDLVAGMARILKPDGALVLDVVSVVDRIDGGAALAVDHERIFHHSLTGLARLLRRHGLHPNDVRPPGVDGRMRIHASAAAAQSAALRRLLADEHERGVADAAFYRSLIVTAEAADELGAASLDHHLPPPVAIAARRRPRRAVVGRPD
jgi:SAM-dependent methyltransferase